MEPHIVESLQSIFFISLLVHISQAQQDRADKSFYLNES